ncbi:MAG: hypothetical protein MdMp014T_0206 [Treponematales bacterium]
MPGVTDTDRGMKRILEEMQKAGRMSAKVGFPDNGDESGGVRVAQYAYWNENGVTSTNNILKKGKLWELPPRPFMARAVDNNRALISQTGERLLSQVSQGKIDARTAMQRHAEVLLLLIKKSIRDGNWKPNSDITVRGIMRKDGKPFIRGKKSTKPLINSGRMLGSVMYQILENNAVVLEGGKTPG